MDLLKLKEEKSHIFCHWGLKMELKHCPNLCFNINYEVSKRLKQLKHNIQKAYVFEISRFH